MVEMVGGCRAIMFLAATGHRFSANFTETQRLVWTPPDTDRARRNPSGRGGLPRLADFDLGVLS